LMLCRLAYCWLIPIRSTSVALSELIGIFFALVAHQYCFSRIARSNIVRLSRLREKTCIFAFQRWGSYLLLPLMVTVGLLLKRSPISKPHLAILYTAIGGALLFSSLQYYQCLWKTLVLRESCLPSQDTTR
jgi:hypothetical protein